MVDLCTRCGAAAPGGTGKSYRIMQPIGPFTFRLIDEPTARQIVAWRYEPPYDLYNSPSEELEASIANLLKPEYYYYSVWDEKGELIAFRCFGPDARVPGGDYRTEALDMGGGLRPDLAGRGLGPQVMAAAMRFARQHFTPPAFRVTVAAFNQRALRACWKVGYRPVQTFQNTRSGQTFVVLIREAQTNP